MKTMKSFMKTRKIYSASWVMAFTCARRMAVTYHGKKKLRGGASFRSSRDQSLMRFRYLGAPQEPVDIEKVKAQMDGRKGIQLKR
jgi:hypothetical protein